MKQLAFKLNIAIFLWLNNIVFVNSVFAPHLVAKNM